MMNFQKEIKKIEIVYEDGHFWQICQDERGEYHFKIDQWETINKMGQFHGEWVWSLQYKETPKQRKFRSSSVTVQKIHALIEIIRAKMESGNFICVARTPDIEVWFYNNK